VCVCVCVCVCVRVCVRMCVCVCARLATLRAASGGAEVVGGCCWLLGRDVGGWD